MLNIILTILATADGSLSNLFMSSRDVDSSSLKVGSGSCKSNAFPRTSSLKKLMMIRGGSSNVVHIKSADEFDQLVAESDGKLIVVDFSAVWCGPCKMIAPVYDEMSSEFADAIFVKIDVDEVPDLAERFKVQAMPTFLFMKGTNEVERFSGASEQKLRQTILANFK
jgi:thioredoxin 1